MAQGSDTPSIAPQPDRRAAKFERLPRTSLFVAVMLVGVITILTILVAGYLLANDKQTPDGLWSLAGVGMGSLGTFLARGQGNT